MGKEQAARVMILLGVILFALAVFSAVGNLSEANRIGDTLAIIMSLAVVAVGATYIIISRAKGGVR